ncbi:FMN-binding protein [bacterium]|nr:FMN-binding protein [candidate division CSSED10-310 bacterium]
MNEIAKMVLVTTIICAFAATLLGGLRNGLSDRIAQQEDFFVRGPIIEELFTGAPNDPLSDKIEFGYQDGSIGIYPWIEDGKIRRIALEQSGRGGYGGDITVMTALDLESNRIFGVRVTQHKETPGVGTRAMEPDYLSNYRKLLIKDDIKLKNDGGQIDAVSGATRSSSAIADGVSRAAIFVNANRESILKSIQEKQGSRGNRP